MNAILESSGSLEASVRIGVRRERSVLVHSLSLDDCPGGRRTVSEQNLASERERVGFATQSDSGEALQNCETHQHANRTRCEYRSSFPASEANRPAIVLQP